MVVARFRPDSSWPNRKISFIEEQFILEDHGPITARDVIDYDPHLVWASQGIKDWVRQKAEALAPPMPEPAEKTPTSPASETAHDDEASRVELAGATTAKETEGQSSQADPADRTCEGSTEYHDLPEIARLVYDAHGGSKRVEHVVVGLAEQCLVLLPDRCVIVKPGLHPSYAEFPYSDIAAVLHSKWDSDHVIDIRVHTYKEPDVKGVVIGFDRRPNCFSAGMMGKAKAEAAADELRTRANVTDAAETKKTNIYSLLTLCVLIGIVVMIVLSMDCGGSGDITSGSRLDRDQAIEALESTESYGDGVWGQMPDAPMEMIAVKVPADSDTGGRSYWVRSRMDATSEWSEGMFYESAEQAVDAMASGGQISEFELWIE